MGLSLATHHVLGTGLQNLITTAGAVAGQTKKLQEKTKAASAVKNKSTTTPAAATATTVSAPDLSVEADHPFSGMSPEELAKQKEVHDSILSSFQTTRQTPEQIQQVYQPAVDAVNALPEPQAPSALRGFFATLGSPDKAPGMLQNATNNALSVQQDKKNHLLSLKEAITHAIIQEQLQSGQAKQALESTLKLDELHRHRELEDLRNKNIQQRAMFKMKNQAKIRETDDLIKSRYGLERSRAMTSYADSVRDGITGAHMTSEIPITDDALEQEVRAAVAQRFGEAPAVTPPVVPQTAPAPTDGLRNTFVKSAAGQAWLKTPEGKKWLTAHPQS